VSASSGSLRLGFAALLAQAALQVVWYGVLAAAPRWPLLALTLAPLAPGIWIGRRNPRRGVLIGGIASLLYFCHGVATAWSDATERLPAFAEIALALAVIGASGWDARHYRRGARTAG
jgi:uncharacterized membrane protein